MKEKLAKLIRVRPYINQERFKKICIENSMTNYRELWENFNNSFLHFLAQAPDIVIESIIELDDKIQNSNKLGSIRFTNNAELKKIVLEDNTFFEVNISSVEGLESMLDICRNNNVKAFLPLTDIVEFNKEKIKLYEGDLIKCYDEWHNGKTSMFLSCMDTRFINPDPYYVELLYTEKYGYLSNGDKPNKDNEAIKFSESLFNVKNGRMNYHCISLTKKWEVVGNIFIDYSVLKPL